MRYYALLYVLVGFQLIAFQTKLLAQLDTSIVLSKSPDKSRTEKIITNAAVPASFILYGFTASNKHFITRQADKNIRNDIIEDHPGFATGIDDKLQYLPVAVAYGLHASGIKGKNNLVDKTAIYLLGNTIMSMCVTNLKTYTTRLRPDASDHRSFPSGHTATAFLSAEFMAEQYKDVSLLYAVGGYSAAIVTGGCRMLNNRHWFSDVVAGAGIGILSAKAGAFLYPRIKQLFISDQQSKWIALPTYSNGQAGFALSVAL